MPPPDKPKSNAGSIQFPYRADIDGLRAVAILLIVLFHANLGFSGGYIGVDVFFVISGFLITGLIRKGQEAGNFSLAAFWGRRIRRIVPAAFVVVAVTLVAGCLLLLPRDLEELSRSVISQQLVASNFYFYRHTGYFHGPAETKALLHTWSLAVEEQFYLGFPLLLVLCARLTKRSTLVVLLGLALVSLGISEWGVHNWRSGSFFLTPSRMWELLLGAMLVFCPEPRRWKASWLEVCSWIGLACVVTSGWMFSSRTNFPGLAALIPCVGVALVIHANSPRPTSLGRMLSNKPLVFLGLISYSLYLWHWPILAFLRYWLGRDLPLVVRLTAIAISLPCAYGSWRFVETPFRRGFVKVGVPRTVLMAVAAASVLLGVSLWIDHTKGLPSRLPDAVRQLIVENDVRWQFGSTASQVREGALPNLGTARDADKHVDFLVWGDSHAMALGTLFDSLGKENDLAGAIAARSSTMPLRGVWLEQGAETLDWNDSVLQYIRDNEVSHVILVSSWSGYVEGRPDGQPSPLLLDEQSRRIDRQEARAAFRRGLERTLLELEQLGTRVWIVKQAPWQTCNPEVSVVRAACLGQDTPRGVSNEIHRERQRNANSIIDSSVEGREGVQVSDPTEYCFDEQGYSRIGSEEGVFYADDNHLSPLGADRLLRGMFESAFREMGHSYPRSSTAMTKRQSPPTRYR